MTSPISGERANRTSDDPDVSSGRKKETDPEEKGTFGDNLFLEKSYLKFDTSVIKQNISKETYIAYIYP